MINLDETDAYDVITPRVKYLHQETYCFITGDAEDPRARVVEVTFHKDSRTVEFCDVTDLHKEKHTP